MHLALWKRWLNCPLCVFFFSTGLAAIPRLGETRSGEARMEAFWFTTQVRSRKVFSVSLFQSSTQQFLPLIMKHECVFQAQALSRTMRSLTMPWQECGSRRTATPLFGGIRSMMGETAASVYSTEEEVTHQFIVSRGGYLSQLLKGAPWGCLVNTCLHCSISWHASSTCRSVEQSNKIGTHAWKNSAIKLHSEPFKPQQCKEHSVGQRRVGL